MKKYILFVGLLGIATAMPAQQIDPLLSQIKQRLDSIAGFEVSVRMEVDIRHVNMPDKTAELTYERGKSAHIESEDFVLIPKRGLDFGLVELYKYPFMTLNLGQVSFQGRTCELVKVIPTTDESDYAIATLWLDARASRILKSQISTKKNGVFDIAYQYAGPADILPAEVRVDFLVNDIRIPLRFLGREAQVDKEQLKADPGQKGAITLRFSGYRVTRAP